MDRYFRTQEGNLVNIIDHTLEEIKKWPHLTIRIGTDSQCHDDKTRYVTTIVYRYGKRGAHFIYFLEELPRIKVDFTRLYEEGMRTLQISDILTSEIPVAIEAMEFDYANIKKTLSTPLVGAFKGYKNAVFKSGYQIACKAADHVCKNPIIYESNIHICNK